MKTASLFVTMAATVLLVGCASKPQQPTYTPQQLAHGIKLEKITANMPLSTKYSRAWSIAHVFNVPVNDVDPEKYLLNNQQLHALNGFVAGTVHAGLEGGLVVAALNTMLSAGADYRSQYDEWNAILDPSKFSTVYEAARFALGEVTTMTQTALKNQGYQVTVKTHQLPEDEVQQGVSFESVLTLVNPKVGCVKPKADEDGCRVILRRMYSVATREAPPVWLSDLKEAFVIRSLGVWSDGKTFDGKLFKLTHEDREAIGRMAHQGYYFYGAFDANHAGFIGENGTVAYCHMPPELLAKSRARDDKGFLTRMKEAAEKNVEKHGWGLLWNKPLFEEEPL